MAGPHLSFFFVSFPFSFLSCNDYPCVLFIILSKPPLPEVSLELGLP
jgi:hypothetical protein